MLSEPQFSDFVVKIICWKDTPDDLAKIVKEKESRILEILGFL